MLRVRPQKRQKDKKKINSPFLHGVFRGKCRLEETFVRVKMEHGKERKNITCAFLSWLDRFFFLDLKREHCAKQNPFWSTCIKIKRMWSPSVFCPRSGRGRSCLLEGIRFLSGEESDWRRETGPGCVRSGEGSRPTLVEKGSQLSGKVDWTYFISFWNLEPEGKDPSYCEAGSWHVRFERIEKGNEWRQLILI